LHNPIADKAIREQSVQPGGEWSDTTHQNNEDKLKEIENV
jgi:hypothetical protein